MKKLLGALVLVLVVTLVVEGSLISVPECYDCRDASSLWRYLAFTLVLVVAMPTVAMLVLGILVRLVRALDDLDNRKR
jgi:uncharacterized BrkB/YihY/UPF0761 family membrane protein